MPLQPLTKAVDIKSFHKLREDAVAEQDSGEPGEIGQWQRDQSQMRAQRRERQINAKSHDRGRQQNDWRSGSTLDEGDMLGANHVHDYRLRQQSDDKPARLKQRLLFDRVRTEHVPHDEEGHDIEDGADGANEHHEAGNAASVPFARLFEKIRVHVVPRDRYLRNVVKKILHQQLDRQHRQEGPKDAGDQHTEYVAEIGTRRHLDVFDDVSERLAPFDDGLFEN